MTDLIANLQRLGDMEHDDLSVAHDALSEIIKLRLEKARLNEVNAELVEACTHLVEGIDACGITGIYLDAARAALAKATGENND